MCECLTKSSLNSHKSTRTQSTSTPSSSCTIRLVLQQPQNSSVPVVLFYNRRVPVCCSGLWREMGRPGVGGLSARLDFTTRESNECCSACRVRRGLVLSLLGGFGFGARLSGGLQATPHLGNQAGEIAAVLLPCMEHKQHVWLRKKKKMHLNKQIHVHAMQVRT